MTTQTSIFICYKKILIEKDSNGNITRTIDNKAEFLNEILQTEKNHNYKPWIDDSQLPPGIEWEKMIYSNLLASDVVIALISKGTSDSEWVQRELALAQAFGISIIPLGFDIEEDDMLSEVRKLGISNLQFIISRNIHFRTRLFLLEELGTSIAQAKARTHSNQQKFFAQMVATRTPHKTPAETNQFAFSFVFGEGIDACKIHIATGDIAKFKSIDVIVNSENNYMQMARFFERRTVSSLLRHLGSRILRGGVFEDTIQHELDWQLKDHSRPVQATEVIATSAGAPGCPLVEDNKARYIFHVASVQAVDAENKVVPYQQPHQVEACVKNSLRKINKIHLTKGIISPKGSDQRKLQEKRANAEYHIKSILIPLFGTGQGGKEPIEVIRWIIDGIKDFLSNKENIEVTRYLKDIYISVFYQDDIFIVSNAVSNAFKVK